ncbi:globin family protein [Aliikangiella sp. G2MR2-5]|uniref:globin family protein n=1 Tax=Aliikangiella sp. G2MR2-5 TaxID=2788943 RepID=UPI0018AB43FF|nr:globin family protein [Aliikangiella sp. G2MR2-5]
MSITERQKQLVRESFAKVTPISEAAAEIFYGKLFEISPEVRRLFKGDLKKQGKMLMQTLSLAVKGLDNLPGLVPVLQKLAERHIQYGVREEDYTPVGNALLLTLKAGLGDDFDQETRDAWIATYRLIAATMKSHAY